MVVTNFIEGKKIQKSVYSIYRARFQTFKRLRRAWMRRCQNSKWIIASVQWQPNWYNLRLTCFPCSSKCTAKQGTLSWIFAHDWNSLSPLWLSGNSQIRKTRVVPSAYTSYPTFIISIPFNPPKLVLLWSLGLLSNGKWNGNLLCCQLLKKGFHARTLSKLISRNSWISTKP